MRRGSGYRWETTHLVAILCICGEGVRSTATAEETVPRDGTLVEVRGQRWVVSDPLVSVVSQAVSALWETVLDARGFAEFTARAVPKLIRWEREYGWSNGDGKVMELERPLAGVLASMLATPEMWSDFADAYLAELDRIAAAEAPPPGKGKKARRSWVYSPYSEEHYARTRRTGDLAYWNSLLLEHLDEERARRLAEHSAFGGTDAEFLRAQAAQLRGDLDKARALITKCLEKLPGSTQYAEFAEEVGAEFPPRARRFMACGQLARSGRNPMSAEPTLNPRAANRYLAA
jgi:hypothetical protein